MPVDEKLSLSIEVGSHRKTLRELTETHSGILRVASAYVTDNGWLGNSTHTDVRLLIGLCESDIVFGSTSLECLESLIKHGVRCRILTGPHRLHAKVYIFEPHAAVVTSANLTTSALDRNIEAGVCFCSSEIKKLVKWFDDLWDSEGSHPLTTEWLSELKDKTAKQRKKFKRFGFVSKSPVRRTVETALPIRVTGTEQFFLCNTDRRHGHEPEKLMLERSCAIAWEPFDYIGHMERIRSGDLLLMYAKGRGIIGVGRAKGTWKALAPDAQDRIMSGSSREWQVPVTWLRWVDAADACAWEPIPYKTLLDVSSERYAAQRKRVLKHFKLICRPEH